MVRFFSPALGLLVFFMGGIALSAADSPLLSAPRAAPEPHQPDLLVGLRKGGKYKGDGVFTSKLISKQRLSRESSPGGITTYFRIQNDSKGAMVVPYSLFEVNGDKSSSRFDVSYFNDKGANVTANVTRGRYVLNIASDAETSLRQRITPKSGATATGAVEVKAENVDTLSKDVAGVLLRVP